MRRATRSLSTLAALSAALVAACASPGVDATGLVPYRGPSAVAEPPAPRTIRGHDEGGGPFDAELPPNGGVADRFNAEGQVVTYRFRAERGQVSVFELGCMGYARGWQAAAGIRILDSSGAPLLERERAGGATFSALTAFTAPADGAYRFELTAAKEYFRYTLVRHASFAANDGRRRALGAEARAYGYLADEHDRALYALDLAAGEAALVSVQQLRERIEKGLNNNRAAALARVLEARGTAGIPDVDLALEAGRMEGLMVGELPSEPLLQLELADGTRVAELLLPAGPARRVELDVVARGPSEGGLYALEIERAPALVPVDVRIGDFDDDPVAGIHVAFLREPRLALLADGTTDAEGRLRVDLPKGEYTLLYRGGEGSRTERAQALVDGEAELNLVWTE